MSPLLVRGPLLPRLTAGLALLLALSTASAHPHYLSYFNLPSGGPYQGYRHALGSNYDWGQDLIALREWMEREGVEEVELFSYGRVDPATYGVRYRIPVPAPLPSSRHLVVSASFYGMNHPLNDHGRPLPLDVVAQRAAIFESPKLELVERITPAWFVFRIRRDG